MPHRVITENPVKLDALSFHTACFTCERCTCDLSLGACSLVNAKPYCNACKASINDLGVPQPRALSGSSPFIFRS